MTVTRWFDTSWIARLSLSLTQTNRRVWYAMLDVCFLLISIMHRFNPSTRHSYLFEIKMKRRDWKPRSSCEFVRSISVRSFSHHHTLTSCTQ
jgi:hypothetical protein